MNQVVASWSGGKDSCLACYRAAADGLKISYLANTITGDGQRSCSHGLPAEIIKIQAQAVGIPLIQRRTTGSTYETEFISMLRDLKLEGIEGAVFGDIDFNPHREWIDNVCREAGIIPHLPLWEGNQDEIMREFIDSGFQAIVVAARADLFGEEILGQTIDLNFIKHLDKLGETQEITPCGEAGEYHTLVIGGPLFKQRVEVIEARKELRDEHWFLEILRAEVRDK